MVSRGESGGKWGVCQTGREGGWLALFPSLTHTAAGIRPHSGYTHTHTHTYNLCTNSSFRLCQHYSLISPK